MLNFDRALNDDRLLKAMTGLSASEFNKLTGSFGQELQNEAWIRYETGVKLGGRERKPGGGRIGNLESDAEKLFFTLFYFKCYPTFDILGFVFDLNRSNANRNTHKLTLALFRNRSNVQIPPEKSIHGFGFLEAVFSVIIIIFLKRINK